MRVLTNKEQVEILKYVKNNFNPYHGLCSQIIVACKKISLYDIQYPSKIKMAIPLFTYENAIIACREKHVTIPKGNPFWYWWNFETKIPRLAFLNWLIEQLEK